MKTPSQSLLTFKYALILTTWFGQGQGSPSKVLMQKPIQNAALETEEHRLISIPYMGFALWKLRQEHGWAQEEVKVTMTNVNQEVQAARGALLHSTHLWSRDTGRATTAAQTCPSHAVQERWSSSMLDTAQRVWPWASSALTHKEKPLASTPGTPHSSSLHLMGDSANCSALHKTGALSSIKSQMNQSPRPGIAYCSLFNSLPT